MDLGLGRQLLGCTSKHGTPEVNALKARIHLLHDNYRNSRQGEIAKAIPYCEQLIGLVNKKIYQDDDFSPEDKITINSAMIVLANAMAEETLGPANESDSSSEEEGLRDFGPGPTQPSAPEAGGDIVIPME